MTTPYIIKELETVIAELKQLQSVQTLEHHNKNWLACPKSVSEQHDVSLRYIRHKVEHVAAVLAGQGEKRNDSEPGRAPMTMDNTKTETAATGRFSITCELPLITCPCEMEFALMAHFTGEEDRGEKEDRWMYQDRCYFCPYCGKKNEELGSPTGGVGEKRRVKKGSSPDDPSPATESA